MIANRALARGHLCFIAAALLNVGVWFCDMCHAEVCLIVIGMVAILAYLQGAWYYSKGKGRSGYWCVLGFLGPMGLLMLLFGPDISPEAKAVANRRRSAEAARVGCKKSSVR